MSSWWNSRHQSKIIDSYVESASNLDDEDYEAILQSAYEYNEWLFESNHSLSLSDDELEDYLSQLVVEDTDIMAYIVIDKINVSLPIYHTTEDAVLQVGIGHLEGSSLPVGGESTHCVLTGHTGLASAMLFTNLDELEIGDTFKIYVLNELLTYEVDQILIVEPTDISALDIVEGEDYCTLITCTPYGINSKRLLVRGHRIENAEEEEEVVDENISLSERSWIWVIALLAAAVLGDAAVIFALRKKRSPRTTGGTGAEPPEGSPGDIIVGEAPAPAAEETPANDTGNEENLNKSSDKKGFGFAAKLKAKFADHKNKKLPHEVEPAQAENIQVQTPEDSAKSFKESRKKYKY